MPIAREQNEREDEGSLLGYLAVVYTVQKNYPKVLYYAQQSLAIAREFGDKDAERIQLTNLMRASNMLNQKALAIFYGKQAVNILQQMRESIRDLTKELQEGFVHHNESDYRELADLLISVGRLPEAEQVINLLKQKEYLDFVRQAEIMATGDLFAGVDLLALSACNTAMSGVAANGTEVEGFNMRAQQQGAKAVLATLWSVSDESTRLR